MPPDSLSLPGLPLSQCSSIAGKQVAFSRHPHGPMHWNHLVYTYLWSPFMFYVPLVDSFLSFFFFKDLFMYNECSICMYTCMPEEGIRSHYRWLWATLCGCWELNSGPLEEQTMLLTSEPSLQPSTFLIIYTELKVSLLLNVSILILYFPTFICVLYMYACLPMCGFMCMQLCVGMWTLPVPDESRVDVWCLPHLISNIYVEAVSTQTWMLICHLG